MFNQIIRNIPDVTKNLVILNILFFVVTLILESQGIGFSNKLSIHYPTSPFFEPYQVITHFFMHGGIGHLFFNMFGLVIFGSRLEQLWGKKRFFIFYIVTAFGATLLHWLTQGFEVYQLTGEIFPEKFYTNLEFIDNGVQWEGNGNWFEKPLMGVYMQPSLGASGSIYGLLAGYALLFPNTEFQLLFPPIPIKAKWLALFLIAGAYLMALERNPDDNIGHIAHLGGALFGFILIQIWKKDRTNFY